MIFILMFILLALTPLLEESCKEKTACKVIDSKGQEMRWAAGDSLAQLVWNPLIEKGTRDQEIRPASQKERFKTVNCRNHLKASPGLQLRG